MDFIGADTLQTAMTLTFASTEPDLRVLLYVSYSPVYPGDFKDILQVVNALERLRVESTVA